MILKWTKILFKSNYNCGKHEEHTPEMKGKVSIEIKQS